MTTSRRRRLLTAEERRLWAHVVRAVTPLGGRTVPTEEEPSPPPVPDAASKPPQPQVKESATAHKPNPPPVAPLVAVERKTMIALRRGRRDVDGVLDLHGMRQTEAHHALLSFLRRSQADGRTLVLIVTGKGAVGSGELFEERGVLRRMVPHWLRLPDLRPLILGFEEAASHHGGTGALYVRLRRSRAPDQR
jgi:DNA-nicking Smr family endonuclease